MARVCDNCGENEADYELDGLYICELCLEELEADLANGEDTYEVEYDD